MARPEGAGTTEAARGTAQGETGRRNEASRTPLPGGMPGTARSLTLHRFGKRGARPRAYLQAALHGDELPGILVLASLLPMLREAERRGRLEGEVWVVPFCNPIGFGQALHGQGLGRFDLPRRRNFNRHFPDLRPAVEAAAQSARPPRDAAALRRCLLAAAAAVPALDEFQALQRQLFLWAQDCDLILDLHCDSEAVNYSYLCRQLWPRHRERLAHLAPELVLLWDGEGGDSFEDACLAPWLRAVSLGLIAPAALPFVTTWELRGEADVEPRLAARDAANLFALLQSFGVVAGRPGAPRRRRLRSRPLSGVQVLQAGHGGVVAFERPLGARLAAGDLVARIVDPVRLAQCPEGEPLYAGTDGLLFTRNQARLVRPGAQVAKIAGGRPLRAAEAAPLDE